MSQPNLTLYYGPRTRSFTALWLLEELGVDYTLESFDLQSGRHKEPDFLALNPMGKVPVVVDRGRSVSELGAIAIYLADIYRDVPLSPSLDDASRPEFLRWVFFASAIVEPAMCEKLFNWTADPSSVAWGSFDQMLAVITPAVAESEWLLGETFSAADVVVGSIIRFAIQFGAIPNEGPLSVYVARLTEREAFKRAESVEMAESERFPAG